jgi:hypothetical protein
MCKTSPAPGILTPSEKMAYCLQISSLVSENLTRPFFSHHPRSKSSSFQVSLGIKAGEKVMATITGGLCAGKTVKVIKCYREPLKTALRCQTSSPCCKSMSKLHVHVHAHASCPCPCCMFMSCCMPMSMLHVHVRAACPCPCCMCPSPCCISMSKSILHVHIHGV